MSAKDLKSVLAGNNQLSELAREARRRANLRDALAAELPAVLADAIVSAECDQRTLRVAVTTGAWATRLRFSEQLCLEAAAAAGLEVDCLSVRVTP
ncbi:MAG: DciA family protein [Pseudomonadota bacterium]